MPDTNLGYKVMKKMVLFLMTVFWVNVCAAQNVRIVGVVTKKEQCRNCKGNKKCKNCHGYGFTYNSFFGCNIECIICGRTGKCGTCLGRGFHEITYFKYSNGRLVRQNSSGILTLELDAPTKHFPPGPLRTCQYCVNGTTKEYLQLYNPPSDKYCPTCGEKDFPHRHVRCRMCEGTGKTPF